MIGVAGGEDYNGDGGPLADLAADLPTEDIRKCKIQNYQIGSSCGGHIDPLPARCSLEHSPGIYRERMPYGPSDLWLVIDDEDEIFGHDRGIEGYLSLSHPGWRRRIAYEARVVLGNLRPIPEDVQETQMLLLLIRIHIISMTPGVSEPHYPTVATASDPLYSLARPLPNVPHVPAFASGLHVPHLAWPLRRSYICLRGRAAPAGKDGSGVPMAPSRAKPPRPPARNASLSPRRPRAPALARPDR